MKKEHIPSIWEALTPIVLLMLLIAANVFWLPDDTLAGANQLSLLTAAAVAVVIAVKNGTSWDNLLKGVTHTILTALPAILMLFIIGMLSGAWMLSGVVPTMIYYGLDILRPDYFLPATLILCALISVAVGSSWSTIATIGVALIGVGQALGFSEAIIAGAIVSGAYFGDKISPLSDTTNLASAVADTSLFTHIKYMMQTTVPSFIITIIIFVILTFTGDHIATDIDIAQTQSVIAQTYNVNPILFVIPVITFLLILKKIPALPVLFIAALLGIIFALIFQKDLLSSMAGGDLDLQAYYSICSRALYGSTEVVTSDPSMNDLFSTGGMAGMMDTIWLIITAMVYGGILEAGHFLEKVMYVIRRGVNSIFGVVSSTAATCILFNITSGDQYISIVIPGKMFMKSYKKLGLEPQLLSRTLEDSATVTSVLIPWNTCGAAQASVLGVATAVYAPFAFFCYISPFMTLLFAAFKIKIKRVDKDETEQSSDNR